jgi:hypothetical protein
MVKMSLGYVGQELVELRLVALGSAVLELQDKKETFCCS